MTTVPRVGAVTMLNVIGSPSGSTALSVPATGMSSSVVIDRFDATGADDGLWLMVTVCSATTMVPARAAAAVFAATVKLTLPFADPPPGGVMVIHGVVVV